MLIGSDSVYISDDVALDKMGYQENNFLIFHEYIRCGTHKKRLSKRRF